MCLPSSEDFGHPLMLSQARSRERMGSGAVRARTDAHRGSWHHRWRFGSLSHSRYTLLFICIHVCHRGTSKNVQKMELNSKLILVQNIWKSMRMKVYGNGTHISKSYWIKIGSGFSSTRMATDLRHQGCQQQQKQPTRSVLMCDVFNFGFKP